jgi:hypothetical protein
MPFQARPLEILDDAPPLDEELCDGITENVQAPVFIEVSQESK